MKRKVLVFLLSLCILVGLLPATAMALEEPSHNNHTICGGVNKGACVNPAEHGTMVNGNGTISYGDHGGQITWTAWTDVPSEAGSYYLTSDVTLSETWTVSADINLDLNGHTIALEDGKTGSVISVSSGTLTICDCVGTGKITGGNATSGGGVCVSSGAKFKLYGGSITGNTATEAGGVYVDYNASFVMCGGSITGNTANDGYSLYGHGPFIRYGGSVAGNAHAVWGGIDWDFIITAGDGTGTLTISPTTGTRQNHPKNTSVICEYGYWPEAVIYVAGTGATIDGWPYDRTKVTELIIEEGVTHIGSFTAKDMPIEGEVVIPSTVTYIGQETFQNSTIKTLTFAEPNGDPSPLCIEAGALKNLQVTSITFPKRLECIHRWVVLGCEKLKSVTFLNESPLKMGGTPHVDYDGNVGKPFNGATEKNFFAYSYNLETVTFTNLTDRDNVFGEGGQGVSFVGYDGTDGHVLYTLDGLIASAAEKGGVVTLNNSVAIQDRTDKGPRYYDTVVIPADVTLIIPAGKTLTINNNNSGAPGMLIVLGRIEGEGTITNNGVYTAVKNESESAIEPTGSGTKTTAYAITYNLNGGTAKGDAPAYHTGTSMEFTLKDPEKTGYTFAGWSCNNLTVGENGEVTIPDESDEDYTFTANWTANAYTVKFDANSGSGSMADVSVAYDEEKDLPANTFVNPGKLFDGWNTAEDGTGTAYTDGQSISNLTAEDGATVTLYAQWSDKPAQTITFDTTDRNATYGDGKLAKRAASAEGTITYTSSDTTVATVDADGTVTVLKVGETVITANAAETAQYAAGSSSYKLVIAPKTLTVTADSHEAYVGSSQPVLTCTVNGFVGTDTFITNPTCTTEADMNSTGTYDIIPGGADAGSNYTITYVKGTLTVSLKKYTVTYKADGKVVDTVIVEHGKDATAPTIPAKEGYNQTAPTWDKDGKNITADTEINAVYTINKYTVTYKADGKVVDTVVVEHGKDATAPTIPAKEGFTGAWDKDGKNITADTEINAVYTINKYTVTYKADGKVVDTVVVEYGKDATAPTIPAKKGYTGAWDKDGKNITADTEINAVYTPISVTPATGDNSHGFVWLTLLFVSGCAIAVLTAYGRKRRNAVKD